MRITLLFHIAAGSLALVFGYIALFAAKGSTLHRRVGRLFVYAMCAMALLGFTMAVVRGVAPKINVPAALLSAYLVITGMTTVLPPFARSRVLHIGGMTVALAIGASMLSLGFRALADGGAGTGLAFPCFMFGVVGTLGAAGDLRVLRAGALRGPARIARHLWRMCFALFIAALSFFIGQARVIPEPIRIYPLLAVPVLGVLVMMFYWLWRVRVRRSLRGMIGATAVEAAR